MNYEEMLARILAGEDEETIVKEFTDNLNSAIKEARIQEEEKAKAAETAALEDHKNTLATSIAVAINEYVMACGMENPGIDTGDVRDLIDSIIEIAPWFKNLAIHVSTPDTRKMKLGTKGKGKSSDDVFAEFFKSLGI